MVCLMRHMLLLFHSPHTYQERGERFGLMTRQQPSFGHGATSEPHHGKILYSKSLPRGEIIHYSYFMFHLLNRYTTESVTSGHPDKVCDQMSDAILDAALAKDPMSRVAIETFGSHGTLMIGGEIKTNAKLDYKRIALKVYKDIGYHEKLTALCSVAEQSNDIALGVDTGGAGDQGMMYGYATDETKEMLPLGVVLAHSLARNLEKLRRSKKLPWLMPDGKTQVTISNGRVLTALVSTQHAKSARQEEIREALIKYLFKPTLSKHWRDDIQVLVNPTGRFVQGGFEADAGLTGRKIQVDTYGGLVPHGGGAFSGKDATKVDRSAAYMCRFVAKNLVANGYAKKALVSVAYAIGRVEPVMVEAFDDAGKNLTDVANKHFDFRPLAIIERLGLRKPIFQQTASYGHFGVAGRPWEVVDRF